MPPEVPTSNNKRRSSQRSLAVQGAHAAAVAEQPDLEKERQVLGDLIHPAAPKGNGKTPRRSDRTAPTVPISTADVNAGLVFQALTRNAKPKAAAK